MELGKSRHLKISDGQLTQAANTLLQLNTGSLFGSKASLVRQRIEAATTLIDAGRKRVREVCRSNLKDLHPGFWATQEEMNLVRKTIVKSVQEGTDITVFDSRVNITLPSLTPSAQEGLSKHVRKVVAGELAFLEVTCPSNALRRLDPTKPLFSPR